MGIDLRKVLEAILLEAKQRAFYWELDYNPDAHIEITLTIAELRVIDAALAANGGGA